MRCAAMGNQGAYIYSTAGGGKQKKAEEKPSPGKEENFLRDVNLSPEQPRLKK